MINPGFRFETYAGKIKGAQTGPTTGRLLIFGTALDGPLNSPTRITDSRQLEKLFGPAKYTNGYKDPNTGTETGKYNGSTIPLAVKQAVSAGATNVYVCRATGQYAAASGAFTNKLDIRAIYPGSVYNDVTITTTTYGTGSAASGDITFTVTQPAVKGGTWVKTFEQSGDYTILDVIDILNHHPQNSTFVIEPQTWPTVWTNAASTIASGTATLSGGSNETNARGEDLHNDMITFAARLTASEVGSFASIKGLKFPFHMAVLDGIHIDDEVVSGNAAVSVAVDFASWLDEMSLEVNPCGGVIGTRPTGLRDIASLIDYINTNLLATTAGFYDTDQNWIKAGPFLYEGFQRYDFDNKTIDVGGRLMVVAGPDVILTHPDVGRYTSNWHVLLAAVLTTVPPERSVVMRELPGVVGYVNKIPGDYADRLINGVGFDGSNGLSGHGAYMVLIPNSRDLSAPMVIYDDCTAAYRNDYFRQYSTTHLCNSIHQTVADAVRNFIGGPSGPEVMAALRSEVQNVLDGFVKSSALKGGRGQGYDFDIFDDGTDADLGIITIFMEIRPANAIRAIRMVLEVKKPA